MNDCADVTGFELRPNVHKSPWEFRIANFGMRLFSALPLRIKFLGSNFSSDKVFRDSVEKSVPQRGSVWVGRDSIGSSVHDIDRPTRYRVVVLTFLIWMRLITTLCPLRTRKDFQKLVEPYEKAKSEIRNPKLFPPSLHFLPGVVGNVAARYIIGVLI